MAIKYKIAEKRKPGANPENELVLSPVIVVSDTIDPKTFLKKLNQLSHIGEPDLVRCLYSLCKLLTNELMDGNIVQTGIFGTFLPSIKKSKKELSKGNIEISVNYRPSLEMKKEMKTADFKKLHG